MDTTGHLTGCVQAIDSLAVCIEYVTLHVYADTAHRMVGRRSEEADTKLRIVEVVGIGLVGAVLVLLAVADQCRELLLADILWLCAIDDRLIIILDGRLDGLDICVEALCLQHICDLADGSDILTTLDILILVWIWSRNRGRCIGDLDEDALMAVPLDTVPELTEGQNITLRGLIYETLAGCRVEVNSVVTAAECEVTVVYPGDRHQLCIAHTGRCSTDCLCHRDTVALQRAAVCGLGLIIEILRIPVLVGLYDLLNVGGITTGGKNDTLLRMCSDWCTIIHRRLHTRYTAILLNQLLGGGTCHDLVVLISIEERGHRSYEVGAPSACILLGLSITIGINIGTDELVLSVPEGTDQGRLCILDEGRTHRLEPWLQILTILDELRNEINIAPDPAGLIRALTETAIVALEDMKIYR